jgi:uncharacterized protein (UPF0335 family)
MSERVGIAGDQLRAIVERIEHVEDEIKELTEAKKEIYQEAKGNGFDVKVLREVIRLRKQDQKERDEQESLLDAYMQGRSNKRGVPRSKSCLTAAAGAGFCQASTRRQTEPAIFLIRKCRAQALASVVRSERSG